MKEVFGLNANELARIAARTRAEALTMIHNASTGHTGGAMSATDILTVLYYDVMNVDPKRPDDPKRDRFFMSKGHSCEPYYAILADRGFFPRSELATFSQAGSRIIGHPNNKVPGVEVCTGALGHGLPVAVGAALGAKRTGQKYKTYVVMGDGEQAEGSVWEAAMAGANYKLDNLFAVVDRNGLQISGPTENVMALDDLAAKWRAFGWDVCEADGNDMQALLDYFHAEHEQGKPHCLIAHTVKGKGLPFAEGKPEWHHKVPNAEQLQEACRALGVEEVDFND
ncbi:MAG: transketolase [Clostridia bacterium]|jgi:transketolase|nr:transketolase [Clostridia bacterium]